MKTHNTFKIILAATQLTLTSIHAAYTSSAKPGTLFQEAIEYYNCQIEGLKNPKEDLKNPRVLGTIEFKLKRVIECEDASEKMLVRCAEIFLSLECMVSFYKTLSRMHLPTYSEFCYNEALRLHTTNAQPHTPQILTEIDKYLTLIIGDPNVSSNYLYKAAYLSLWLNLRPLYVKLVNNIFNSKYFNPKEYKSFIKRIRLLKKQLSGI